MTNQEVLQLQKMLNTHGYRDKNGKKLTEDGLLGMSTTYALQNMLNDSGFLGTNNSRLSADGIWGANTEHAYKNYSGGLVGNSAGSKNTVTANSKVHSSSSPPPIYLNYHMDKLAANMKANQTPLPAAGKQASSVVFDTGASLDYAKQNALSWQKLLNREGYGDSAGNRLSEDGRWGPKTQYAWEQYQKQQAPPCRRRQHCCE